MNMILPHAGASQECGTKKPSREPDSYVWQGGSREALDNLQVFIQACDVIWPHLQATVSTCQEYMDQAQAALGALTDSRLKPLVFQANYGGPRLCCTLNLHVFVAVLPRMLILRSMVLLIFHELCIPTPQVGPPGPDPSQGAVSRSPCLERCQQCDALCFCTSGA